MGSGSAVSSSNDSAAYDLINRKTRQIDSGTAIKASTKAGAGQQSYCDSSSAGMIKGYPYVTDSTNTIHELEQSNYMYPAKCGVLYPCSTSYTVSSNGLLDAATTSGTVGLAALSSTNGLANTFATAASGGSQAGFNMGTLYTVRNFNPIIKCKIALSAVAANTRFFVGWTSSTSLVGNTDDPLNALSGFGIGKTSGAPTNWRNFHNDGSGATVDDDTSVAASTNLTTIDLWADDNATKFWYSIDGATPVGVTTEIPATTTNLSSQIIITTAEAVAKTLSVYSMYISTDK